MVEREEIHDTDLTIRFKHGNHTIFLFVDPTRPFADAAQELLEILRERYPGGLTTSASPPKTTPLPSSADRLEFAVLKNRIDPTKGWRVLHMNQAVDTPASQGVPDTTMIAFAIRPEEGEEGADAEVEKLGFDVDFPSYEDEYAEEAQ